MKLLLTITFLIILKTGLVYRLQWKDVEDQLWQVDLEDTYVQVADDAEVQYVSLKTSGVPLTIDVVDTDEDKFKAIRAKQATLRFLSDTQYNLNTFRQGPIWDFRFRAIIKRNNRLVLYGYNIIDDMGEPFLSPRNEVAITITDRLGGLRDVDLVDFNDLNPKNEYRIAEFVAMCLRKTGHSLPINVISNLRDRYSFVKETATFNAGTNTIQLITNQSFEIGHTYQVIGSISNDANFVVTAISRFLNVVSLTVTGPVVNEAASFVTIIDITQPGQWWDRVYLDAKTWEGSEVGTCIKCYQVLEEILGEHGFITQEKGEWWVKWIDEYDQHPIYVTRFNAIGEFIEEQPGTTYNKVIGRTQDIKFINKTGYVQLNGPKKYIKEEFSFVSPKEIICNIDFQRGELLTDVSETEKHYKVECWEAKNNGPGTNIAPTFSAYIKRIFEDGYERERYLVVGANATQGFFEYMQCEPAYLDVKDKFRTSVDFKFPNTITGFANYYFLLRCVLFGDDGSIWILGNAQFNPANFGQTDYKWYNTTNWTVNTGAGSVPLNFTNIDDEREFQTISWSAPPAPVAGQLKLWLQAINQTNQSEDNIEIHYNNLQFEHIPYINASYQDYLSQYNKITQAVDPNKYIQTREKPITISDSPRRTFKGSLLVINNWNELYDGTATFGGVNSFVLPGDRTGVFRAGQTIRIIGSASNDGTTKITQVVYHIIGDNTEIFVTKTTPLEADVEVEIEEPTFTLAGNFYNAAVFHDAPPADDFFHPFSYIQAFAIFNQYNRDFGTIRGSLKGLSSNAVDGYDRCDMPGLMHTYSIADGSPHTANKKFQLISFSMNCDNCQWSAVFKEVFDTVKGKVYGDTHEFKFKESR